MLPVQTLKLVSLPPETALIIARMLPVQTLKLVSLPPETVLIIVQMLPVLLPNIVSLLQEVVLITVLTLVAVQLARSAILQLEVVLLLNVVVLFARQLRSVWVEDVLRRHAETIRASVQPTKDAPIKVVFEKHVEMILASV
jgi:hypothetical protein